jgi:hypothetical protein
MDLPEIRPGTVEIDLTGWGRPLKLVPSLDAAMSLNRRYGGFGPLTDKVRAYDLDVFVAIIAAGAKVTEAGLAKLPDCVWQTGMFNPRGAADEVLRGARQRRAAGDGDRGRQRAGRRRPFLTMSHEQFWSWLYQIGTAGLGWPPDVVMATDMSDILLAWEGKAALAKAMYSEEDAPALNAETFAALVRKAT